MKFSIYLSSTWLLFWFSSTTTTVATTIVATRSDESPQRLVGGTPPRLRQSRHHESRVVTEVEAAAVLELDDFELADDSADELDMTSVICHIVEYDVQFLDTEEENDGNSSNTTIYQDDDGPFHACFTDDSLMDSSTGSRYGNESGDQVYTIIVPPETLAQLNLEDESKSFISISKAIVNRDKATIEIVDDALVALVDPPEFFGRRLERRKLSTSKGNNIILVLRVNYRGVEPDLSASELEGIFFGQGADKVDVSLSSQMEACSFGQLRYQAAQGDGIDGGVAEIYIQQSVGGDVQVLENAVLKQFNADFDDDFKDSLSNVVLVMPKDSLKIQGREWLAYGYLNGYLTVYNNHWAGSLSAIAHELGHNKNLHHSGRGNQSYADVSGYMGYGSTDIGAPATCFNAQKHFNLGWFEARGGVRRLDMSNDLPWMGYLAFFGDYKVTAMNQPVVINIGSSKPRLFLQYNRAKGINHETRMAANSVVIVRDDGSSQKSSGVQSWFAGELKKVGDSWGYSKFHGNFDLFIRLCEITSGTPDVVRLSIILNDGKQKHTCDKEMPPICDDDLTKMFMTANGQKKTCVWLGREANTGQTRVNNCVPGKEAYDVCAETCGKCTDDCEDTPGVDFVVDNLGRKDCLWLSTRSVYREKLCRYGHAAFEHCHESCNRCDFP